VRNSEIANQHFVRGQQLMTLADAAAVDQAADETALGRACALAAVAQSHFHAAIAATTIGTQRELVGLAAGEIRTVVEQHERDTRPAASALVLERVRTEDDAYRVFEPNGIGTGAVTYDPVIGGAGHLEVTGTLSRDFDAEREARIVWDLMKRGRDAEEGTRAIFERLEYLYRRLAPSDTRPYPSSTAKEGTR
jgi:hypothetical protein